MSKPPESFFKVHPPVWYKRDLETLNRLLHQFIHDYEIDQEDGSVQDLLNTLGEKTHLSPNGSGTPLSGAMPLLLRHGWYPEDATNRHFVKHYTGMINGELHIYLARMSVLHLFQKAGKHGEQQAAETLMNEWDYRAHAFFNNKGGSTTDVDQET